MLVLAWACVPDAMPSDGPAEAYLGLLAAEDARPTAGPELELLLTAIADPEPLLRRTALRSLGRLEDTAQVDVIAVGLEDPDATVRAAAALALAQAVHPAGGGDASGGGDATGSGAAAGGAPGAPAGGEALAAAATPTRRALSALTSRATVETDAAARGAIGRALGRLAVTRSERDGVLETLLALSRPTGGAASGVEAGGGDAPTRTLVGVALGLAALASRFEDDGVGLAVAERLEELLGYRRDDANDVEAARVRALSISALASTRRLTEALVSEALEDPGAEVRRIAVREVGIVVPSRRPALIRRALEDRSVRVAIEATRAAASAGMEETCADLVAAAGSGSPPPLRVAALTALAAPCPGTEQGGALRAAAGELDETTRTWRPAAQALGSLARIDPGAAGRLLPRYVYHPSPFVRTHAARAATALRETDALYALARDASPIVRTAAIDGLFALEGRRVDDLLREQLASNDPELILTAAQLLLGSALRRDNALAALAAFERISATGRETLRDPRLVLLEHVDASGDGSLASRLQPYLGDYDPVVARRVGAILDDWLGQSHEVAPRPPPRAPLPTADELAALERTTVVLYVRDLGEIVIRPLPHEALTNAWRFVRLAREGYYDGLTFHRWAVNFVIQGGSPGANEYAGDGPFSRDELGSSHWRGTVGLSTRGRDTGDGQLFINLSDNVRLDPDYTVFAVVTDGLDVVEQVLEGAVIERVEVRERP